MFDDTVNTIIGFTACCVVPLVLVFLTAILLAQNKRKGEINKLINDLRANLPEVRRQSASELGRRKVKQATRLLVNALQDHDAGVRNEAASALTRMRWKPATDFERVSYYLALNQADKCLAMGRSALTPMIEAFKRGDHQAADLMVRLNDNRVVTEMIGELKKGNRNAADVLARIGDQRAIDALIDMWVGDLRSGPPEKRRQAAKELGRHQAKQAIASLVDALRDQDISLVKEAAGALTRMQWKPVTERDSVFYYLATGQADKCLAMGSSAFEPLIEAFRLKTLETTDVLVRLDDERVVEQMISELGRGFRAAGYVLEQKGDERAVEPLIKSLKGGNDTAAGNLAKIGNPRAIQPLVETLGDQRKYMRKAAAQALYDLYLSGMITDDQKKSILSHRDRITAPHADYMGSHTDTIEARHFDAPPHDCTDHRDRSPGHMDSRGPHTDRGIGGSFPI